MNAPICRIVVQMTLGTAILSRMGTTSGGRRSGFENTVIQGSFWQSVGKAEMAFSVPNL